MDEIELFGFPLCNPFSMTDIPAASFTMAKDLGSLVGSEVEVFGYYITQKPVRTQKGQFMQFGTFIDQKGDWLDTVHFPDVAATNPLTGTGFYYMKGKVVDDFGVFALEVKWMKKTGFKKAGNDQR